MQLQARYRQLHAMLLPSTDPDELAELDGADFTAMLDNPELVGSEMVAICEAQKKLLDDLGRR
jgi:hypothetical protein